MAVKPETNYYFYLALPQSHLKQLGGFLQLG